jgi:uncharacterized membrane protein YeaQ/YmgE (transglycosylase-associated protein family)
MASYFPKEDRLYLLTMLLAVSLAVANAVFSIYAVDLLDIYAINVPFSVAYQPVYPVVIFLVVVPVCLFMRSSKPWRTVIAGMVLGLVGGVYANDILDTFFPYLWLGGEPASIMAMLVTACVVPMAVTLLELRRQAYPQALA